MVFANATEVAMACATLARAGRSWIGGPALSGETLHHAGMECLTIRPYDSLEKPDVAA